MPIEGDTGERAQGNSLKGDTRVTHGKAGGGATVRGGATCQSDDITGNSLLEGGSTAGGGTLNGVGGAAISMAHPTVSC
jgi:hypothetical protein